MVRNKTPKSRNNQQPSSAHSMGNQSGRGRNYRGGPPQMPGGGGGGRGYYDQIPPQYLNQSQQFYHHQQAPPIHMGLSYHNNNHNRHQQPSAGGGGGGGSRQRLNSNRSNTDRPKRGNSDHFEEINDKTASPGKIDIFCCFFFSYLNNI
jgi:hypothetical protein